MTDYSLVPAVMSLVKLVKENGFFLEVWSLINLLGHFKGQLKHFTLDEELLH